MLTEKQKKKLLDHNLIHDVLFEWIRYHLTEIPYEDLTKVQLRTLELVADMPKEEQRKYIILDDILTETPTNREYYSKLHGRWGKREMLRVNTRK